MSTLSQIASGAPAVPSNPGTGPITLVSNPNYCQMTPTPSPTKSTIPIDPNNLIQNACGYFEMDVDNSNTAATSVIWGFGGGIVAGNGTQNKALYEYPNLAFAVDTEVFKDGYTEQTTTYASAASSNYLNGFVFGYIPMIIADVTFQSTGTTASYNTLSKTPWIGQSLQPWGNFYQAKLPFAPDICNPCFNSDNSTIHWGFTAGISATTPLTISIPAGAAGTFRFCVKGYASTPNFTDCATA